MVLYNVLTVVYLYERSLHIFFVSLFLFHFILCEFLLLLLFLNQEDRSILPSLHHPRPSPDLSRGFLLTDN